MATPNLITATEVAGASVYGVKQYDYTVDGVAHQDYAAALTVAAFRESVAIEESAGAVSQVVRERQRKLEDLGYALAVINKAVASMKVKNQERGDKSASDTELSKAKNTLAKYGLYLNVSNNQITRETGIKAQSDIQYAVDTEDNNLQQDIVTLQSLMTKRDNAFSTASKVVKKSLDASAATIGNM